MDLRSCRLSNQSNLWWRWFPNQFFDFVEANSLGANHTTLNHVLVSNTQSLCPIAQQLPDGETRPSSPEQTKKDCHVHGLEPCVWRWSEYRDSDRKSANGQEAKQAQDTGRKNPFLQSNSLLHREFRKDCDDMFLPIFLWPTITRTFVCHQ